MWMIVGMAIALGGVASLKAYRNMKAANARMAAVEAPPPLPVPAGESFDGVALPQNDIRTVENPSDLSLRQGCGWGVPGRNPYKGTVTQALAGARLPQEVVHKIGAMVERGIVSDRVEITRDSIRTASGKRRFEPTITAMAFGETLCFGTRVNFHPGHVEWADLYDATDATGRNYAVMVPYVCRNVSVLAERAERPGGEGNGGSVPEPGTLATLLLGLAVLVGVRLASQRRGAQRANK
jgi:hypothetical protein